jgi:hypothetical protein
MEKSDIGGLNGRAVVGERTPTSRPIQNVGCEDVLDEGDVAVAKDETLQPWFIYEEPPTASLRTGLRLSLNGKGGVMLEIMDFDEEVPYGSAVSIQVPWEQLEALSLWIARQGFARQRERLRPHGKTGR